MISLSEIFQLLCFTVEVRTENTKTFIKQKRLPKNRKQGFFQQLFFNPNLGGLFRGPFSLNYLDILKNKSKNQLL